MRLFAYSLAHVFFGLLSVLLLLALPALNAGTHPQHGRALFVFDLLLSAVCAYMYCAYGKLMQQQEQYREQVRARRLMQGVRRNRTVKGLSQRAYCAN